MITIDQIIQDHGKYIYNYALKLTYHPTDAEDLAQETFIKAWKNLDSLNSEQAIKKWLRTICYHQFLMKIRQKGSRIEELLEDFQILEQEGILLNNSFPNPVNEVLVEEEIKELQNGCFFAMVRKLTLNQRIVFSLVDMYGMQIADVAQILETSVLATKGLLYRARMNIDSFFAGHCNILNINNPCSCKAWITFSSNRNNLQNQTKKLIDTLKCNSSWTAPSRSKNIRPLCNSNKFLHPRIFNRTLKCLNLSQHLSTYTNQKFTSTQLLRYTQTPAPVIQQTKSRNRSYSSSIVRLLPLQPYKLVYRRLTPLFSVSNRMQTILYGCRGNERTRGTIGAISSVFINN